MRSPSNVIGVTAKTEGFHNINGHYSSLKRGKLL